MLPQRESTRTRKLIKLRESARVAARGMIAPPAAQATTRFLDRSRSTGSAPGPLRHHHACCAKAFLLTRGTHRHNIPNVEKWDYAFDPEKNTWLIRERGISFEQIIALIESGHLVQVLEHHDRERYPNQLLYEVDVGGYIYVVPVVRDHQTLFLKTIYPSRKATRSRAKGRPS